jgi:hypothetical protein
LSSDRDATSGRASEQPCGLLLNPFRSFAPDAGDEPLGIELVTHAAASALLVAVSGVVSEGSHKPVWVEKDLTVPGYYHLRAVGEVLALTGPDGSLGLLGAYVPLVFMKMGRVRAAVSTLAERLTGPSLPRTLGAYAAEALAEPDESLPEYAALSEGDVAGTAARFAADPSAVADEVFGPWVGERDGAEDLEMLMRESTARMTVLETDPEAAEESDGTEAESVTLDDVGAGGAPMPSYDEQLEEADTAPAAQLHEHSYSDDVAAYVIAHMRAHLSPVLARGIAEYRRQGSSAAAQELKITKAPRKTLSALARFATYGFDGVLLMFDQFGDWDRIGQDMRLAIASSLMEMRWALEGSGVVAILSSGGGTPELEEQFAMATRVDWDMTGLSALEGADPSPSDIPLAEWLEAASLGEPSFSAADPVFSLIAELRCHGRRRGGRRDGARSRTAGGVGRAAARRGRSRRGDRGGGRTLTPCPPH